MAYDPDTKDALKEAIKEWMDDKFLTFGKWSAGAIGVLLFAALVYMVLTSLGWRHG